MALVLNEIKKLLYKQNPNAKLIFIRKGIAHYVADVLIELDGETKVEKIHFEVPITDMGDADFLYIMDGKFLIRWIVIYGEEKENTTKLV